MTETEDSKPTIRRPANDPLGYDTRRPFRKVAREMADDALAGRHKDAVDTELETVRGRWDNDGSREQDDRLEELIAKLCVDIGFQR